MVTTAVVVMEHGSEWPGHVSSSMSVLALEPDEPEAVYRTEEGLDALRRSHQRVQVAMLACNPALDTFALATRARLARVLLDSVARDVDGRLILCASVLACGELRTELLGHVGALTQASRGTLTTVSLRFIE